MKCKSCPTTISFGSRCQKCKEKHNQEQKDRRLKFLSEGRCGRCGNPNENGKTSCDACLSLVRNVKSRDNCTRCGKSRKEGKFIKGKNLCCDCASTDTRNRNKHKNFAANRKRLAEQSPTGWLRYLLYSCKYSRRRNKRKNLVFDLSLDQLLDLLKQQDRKCAITNLPMSYKYNDLFAINIDRIDSNEGYTSSNIQLVCKATNLAKNTHSNEDIIAFFEAVKRVGNDTSNRSKQTRIHALASQ